MKRSALPWIAGLVCLLLAGSAPVIAQNSKRAPAFVYGINAAIPTGYTGTFAPPQVATLYLLSDQISVIAPRITEIYFWPITNEYRADWDVRNDLVPGTLELIKHGQVVDAIKSTTYTIQFTPQGMSNSSSEIFVGQAAVEANTRFEAKQAAFRQAASTYYADEQAWMAAMEQARVRREAGETVPIPPEPQQPAPIGIFSNGLNQGFPLKLAPDSYQIRVRSPNGQIVPESQRALTVIAPRRTAVGYTVVPETRWTTPEQVDDLSDLIIGKPATNLYLEPHVIREYPARAYDRLQNPQYVGSDTADWKWASGETIKAGLLEIVTQGQAAERRPLTPYEVKQLPGKGLDYEVVKFDPSQANAAKGPDFAGYPIRLEADQQAYQVQMISSEGRVIQGSRRLVRVPARVSLAQLALLPCVPLVLGAIIIFRRRLRMKLPRNVMK